MSQVGSTYFFKHSVSFKRKAVPVALAAALLINPLNLSAAQGLVGQRATHAVQLLDNVRAGALAYYAKNHNWPISSNTPTSLQVLLDQNFVSGLTSYYASAGGAAVYEPVSAYVDPGSHALIVLLNVLEANTDDNVYASRFITDNIVSTSQLVGGNRQIKMVIPPPPAASTATTQLSRLPVPGNPDLNKMETSIDMQAPGNGAKHDIKNVNNLDSQTLKVGDVNSATNIPATTPHTFAVFGTSVFTDKTSFGDGTATGSVNHSLTNPVNVEIQHAAVIDEISAGEIGVDDLTVYNSSVFDEKATVNFKKDSTTTFEAGSNVNFNGSAVTLDAASTVNNAATNTHTGTTNFTGLSSFLNVENFAKLNLKKDGAMNVQAGASVQMLPNSTMDIAGATTFKSGTQTNFEDNSTTTFKPGSVLNLNGTVNYVGVGTTTYTPQTTVQHQGVVNHVGTTAFLNGSQTNFQGDTNYTGADIDINSASTLDVDADTTFTDEVTYASTSDTTFESGAEVTFATGSDVTFDTDIGLNGDLNVDSLDNIKLANGNSYADELKSSLSSNIEAKPSWVSYAWSGNLKAGDCKVNLFLDEGIYTVKYTVDSFNKHEPIKQKLIAIRYNQIYSIKSFSTELFSTPTFDAKGDHEYAFKVDFNIVHAYGQTMYCLKAHVYKNNNHDGWNEKHDQGWWAGMANAVVYEITPFDFALVP